MKISEVEKIEKDWRKWESGKDELQRRNAKEKNKGSRNQMKKLLIERRRERKIE